MGNGGGKMNPVQYAEDVLEVHAVHDEAVSLFESVAHKTQELARLHGLVRETEQKLEDREFDITQSVDPSEATSKTALQELIKARIKSDDECRTHRRLIADSRHEVYVLEGEVRAVEWRLKIAIARMEELGGLLQFFAATKLKS